jgi:exoribonuclease II
VKRRLKDLESRIKQQSKSRCNEVILYIPGKPLPEIPKECKDEVILFLPDNGRDQKLSTE